MISHWITLVLFAYSVVSLAQAPPRIEEIAVVRDLQGEWVLSDNPPQKIGKGQVLRAGAHIVVSPEPPDRSGQSFLELYMLTGEVRRYHCCSPIDLPRDLQPSPLMRRIWNVFLKWLQGNPPQYGTAISGIRTGPLDRTEQEPKLTVSFEEVESLLKSSQAHFVTAERYTWDLTEFCSSEKPSAIQIEPLVEHWPSLSLECQTEAPRALARVYPSIREDDGAAGKAGAGFGVGGLNTGSLWPGVYTVSNNRTRNSRELVFLVKDPSNDNDGLMSGIYQLGAAIQKTENSNAAESFIAFYFANLDRSASWPQVKTSPTKRMKQP